VVRFAKQFHGTMLQCLDSTDVGVVESSLKNLAEFAILSQGIFNNSHVMYVIIICISFTHLHSIKYIILLLGSGFPFCHYCTLRFNLIGCFLWKTSIQLDVVYCMNSLSYRRSKFLGFKSNVFCGFQ